MSSNYQESYLLFQMENVCVPFVGFVLHIRTDGLAFSDNKFIVVMHLKPEGHLTLVYCRRVNGFNQ